MRRYRPPFPDELSCITVTADEESYGTKNHVDTFTSADYYSRLHGNAFLAGEFPDGITTVEGLPVSADIKVLYRMPGFYFDGWLAGETKSAQDGTWLIDGLYSGIRYDVIARYIGRNDVIASDVLAVRKDVISTEGEFVVDAASNTVSGDIFLLSGLPPFSAVAIEPLPSGLEPVISGRKLSISGAFSIAANWASVVRVTAANGVFVDVPVVSGN